MTRKTLLDAITAVKATEPRELALDRQVRALRAENSKLASRVGNWEALCASFVQYAPLAPSPRPFTLKARPAKYAQEMVALLSDSHCNEQWTSDKTEGQTEYNFDIFCRELQYYGEEIVRLAHEDRAKYGLRILHVDALGDIYHGTLRLEDEVTNEFASVPGIANTAAVLFQWLCGLLEHFEAIRMTCMAGNHGRNHRKPQSKRYVEENKDTLVYCIVKQMAQAKGLDSRLRIVIPRSRTYTLTRLGHRVKIGHGDHVKGGNSIAGLPIYGLSREMLRQFRKEIKGDAIGGIDLIEYGHWHQYSMLENMLIINGALAPTDPWAFDEMGALADPTQLVYYTSRKYGIGWRNPLSLKHAGPKHSFTYDTNALIGVD